MSARRNSPTAFMPPATRWRAPAELPLAGLGRAGTVGLAGFVAWMVAGRGMVAAHRPPLVLVGWDAVQDTLRLRVHALGAFRLALAGLWVALPLWVATGGFRRGPGWVPLASLATGLAGLVAAVPVLAVLAAVALNLVLFGVALLLGMLLLCGLLLRVLTAPLRR